MEDIISKVLIEYVTVFCSILLISVSILNIKMKYASNNIITFKISRKELLVRIIGLDSIFISIVYAVIWYLYIRKYDYTIFFTATVFIYLSSLFRIEINSIKQK